MKHLSFSFETTVLFDDLVEEHYFVLRCTPSTMGPQVVSAHLDMEPQTHVDMQVDNFGNSIAVGCVDEPHDHIGYHSYGRATVDRTKGWGAEAHPLFRFDSPLAAAGEGMVEWLNASLPSLSPAIVSASASSSSSAPATGASGITSGECIALMHAVNGYMAYEPGSTSVSTTAAEAFAQKRGVCQDYAHVLIALLRATGTPARYASGLTVGEGATHAWVQAFSSDAGWVDLDPTRDTVPDETYLVCALGRDWSDCPVERGTFFGGTSQTQSVFVQVEEER